MRMEFRFNKAQGWLMFYPTFVDNNTFNGITASFTPDLTVGINTAAYNGKDGISLSTIEYNDVTFNPTITVSQNNASYNGDVGIQEVNCNNAQISLNTIYYNSYAGISASYGGHSNGTINDIYHNIIIITDNTG